jgi:hypothetical protein
MSRAPLIDTRYRGYRFRSRLEARWAVFLDALLWSWVYEPEGYSLPSGWYLPDFWVEPPGHAPLYLEIKWAQAEPEEINRCRDLCLVTGRTVLIAEGAVPLSSDDLRLRGYLHSAPETLQGLELKCDPGELSRALRAARGARFEFEEQDH